MHGKSIVLRKIKVDAMMWTVLVAIVARPVICYFMLQEVDNPKTGTSKLKSYPASLQSALNAGEPLRANRRGVVPLSSEHDKPIITPSELIQLRRLGLSYKQIGRKLGIDPHKVEVLQVYHAVEKSTKINIETFKAPSKVTPPTPLWSLFSSEIDEIQKNLLPSKTDVLQLQPQNRIRDRLGDNAGYMMAIYLKVSEIMREEVQSAITGAPANSSVGKLNEWTGDVSSQVLAQAASIYEAVGHAAYQITDYWKPEAGRCKCSAVKALRFGWHSNPIPHASFFWGCSKFSPLEPSSHDKAIPFRTSLQKTLDDKHGKPDFISDKDLQVLSQKLLLAKNFWDEKETVDEELFKHATSLYGPHFNSKQHILSGLDTIIANLADLLDARILEQRM